MSKSDELFINQQFLHLQQLFKLHVTSNYLTNDLGLKIDSLQNILFYFIQIAQITNQHPLQLLDLNFLSIYYSKQINVNTCTV